MYVYIYKENYKNRNQHSFIAQDKGMNKFENGHLSVCLLELIRKIFIIIIINIIIIFNIIIFIIINLMYILHIHLHCTSPRD